MAIGQYDYEGLCQAYLTHSQPQGTTAKGRLSFKGTRLYSYNSLLAELDLKNKVLLIDKNIASYSKTSNKHTSRLYTTAKKLENFTVYTLDLDIDPISNLTEDLEDLHKLVLKYKQARKNKPYIKDRLILQYNKVKSYIEYAHIDKRTKQYKQFKQFFNVLFEAKLL